MTYDRSSSAFWSPFKPKSSITRLRNGSLNVMADPTCEVAQRTWSTSVRFQGHGNIPIGAGAAVRCSRASLRPTLHHGHRLHHVDLMGHEAIGGTSFSSWRSLHFTFFLPWAGYGESPVRGRKDMWTLRLPNKCGEALRRATLRPTHSSRRTRPSATASTVILHPPVILLLCGRQ